MNWFKSSWHAHRANESKDRKLTRHKRIKKTAEELEQEANDTLMTKSLSALPEQQLEIQDPEIFFHDPEHVRNYKEEAVFLNLMSEWEIIPHPSRAYSENFFSADFEEQFLQMRTQQNIDLDDEAAATAAAVLAAHQQNMSSCVGAADNIWTETTVVAATVSACASTAAAAAAVAAAELERQQQLQWEAAVCEARKLHETQQDAQQTQPQRRRLCELLFADTIQLGIALPRRHYGDNDSDTSGCGGVGDFSSEKRAKKRKAAPPPHLHVHVRVSNMSILSSSCSDTSTESVFASTTTGHFCTKRIVKDRAIDRIQMKTEALAGSIMGAIGRCPNKDFNTSCSSLKELKRRKGDKVKWSACDHYDVKEFFRLDDYGNICLSMKHIRECKGFGFAVAQNRRLYRRCLKQVQIAKESYSKYCVLLKCVKSLLLLLWNLLCGHPRNKTNPYGAGPGDSVRAYTLQLAQDHSSTFARNIENFISCTKESREAAPQVVMRNMRQFMNGMKNYLVKHGEGKFHEEVETARSHLKPDEFLNLDAILETVMHQLIVLPLREHLYGMFVDYYTRSEDIQLLAQNVKYACGRCAADFGIRATVTPPSNAALHAISNLLLRLQEAELPLDKLDIFLCVISTIFDATGCPRGQQLGADDFLPVLVYVVAKCGFVGAEIEAEFMWGLLQPTLLNGEPGYYLTALCSAVHVLKSFMASENENGTGSLDWRSSSLPACSSVLRVIIPDECNGSLQTRTLPVRPHTTTREVCRIIAHKARITNPQDYALFKLVDGEETLLNETECPQDIRMAAIGKHCMLAYKRIDAKIAWPTAATQSTVCN